MEIDYRAEQYQAEHANTYLEYLSGLNIDVNPGAIRHTSIICTIGECVNFYDDEGTFFICTLCQSL